MSTSSLIKSTPPRNEASPSSGIKSGATTTPANSQASSSSAASASDNPDASVDILLKKMSIVPHHAISLRRNKYRVIRRVAK